MKEIPNTAEEIRARILELEAEKIRLEAKQSTKKNGRPPKTPVTEEAREETIIIKKDPISDQLITKQVASEEIQNELKKDKPYFIGGLVALLFIYGLTPINLFAGGLVALICVGFFAFRLAQITKKSNYLKNKYGV